jgi:hypothetical protein
MQDLLRYSIINKKNPREIVLLRGRGCEWKKCSFCDYHLDCSKDVKANFSINKKALDQVTGMYHSLEVINSGSFTNLDTDTIAYIQQCCADKKITSLRFECHWLSRNSIKPLKELFRKENVIVKIKMGVESFNVPYREQFLNKGMGSVGPEEIAKFADEVCLLQGIEGQTEQSMKSDIETGLQYFERVCVNIMTPNTTSIHPDLNVQRIFREKIAPLYIDNSRVDILFENTDFGVGGKNEISK